MTTRTLRCGDLQLLVSHLIAALTRSDGRLRVNPRCRGWNMRAVTIGCAMRLRWLVADTSEAGDVLTFRLTERGRRAGMRLLAGEFTGGGDGGRRGLR